MPMRTVSATTAFGSHVGSAGLQPNGTHTLLHHTRRGAIKTVYGKSLEGFMMEP